MSGGEVMQSVLVQASKAAGSQSSSGGDPQSLMAAAVHKSGGGAHEPAAGESANEVAEVLMSPSHSLIKKSGEPLTCAAINDGIGAGENSWNPMSDISWENKFVCPDDVPELWSATYVNGGKENAGVIFFCCEKDS